MECYLLPLCQFMPAQPEARRETNASLEARWRRNRVVSRRLLRIIGFVLCIFGGSLAACAQQKLTGFSPSLANLSLNLALFSRSSVSGASLNGKEQSVRLAFDSRFSMSLKELAAEMDLNAVPKSILRKQLVWPSEGPRAKVRPGFGELFHGETVEPLRCSGAGVEDSRYLYVKFSFRF